MAGLFIPVFPGRFCFLAPGRSETETRRGELRATAYRPGRRSIGPSTNSGRAIENWKLEIEYPSPSSLTIRNRQSTIAGRGRSIDN